MACLTAVRVQHETGFEVEVRGLVQCLGLLCIPCLLPPFGLGSVTIFDPALARASPSQKPEDRVAGRDYSYPAP